MDRVIIEHDLKMAFDDGYQAGLEAAAPKWISVEERLPEAFHSVLIHMPNEAPLPTVHEGYIGSDGVWRSVWYLHELEDVTHWMPLPMPPEVCLDARQT